MAEAQGDKKSGLRVLKAGEVLFQDGASAGSLFIIQKGQIRLYKPKGKGFIEIAVLRAGEVIGEMAFFDDDGSGGKRSCAAAALTHVEAIEISFAAFAKTMQALNPWFKTIINTLATRLRKANSRIKELEDNQASVSYGTKAAGYQFLKPLEIMRILGTIFLVFKAHGEVKGDGIHLGRNSLTLYTFDMYQIIESKLETILSQLVNLGWLKIQDDEDGLPNKLILNDIDQIKQIFVVYNSERHLPEDKKIRVSDRAEGMMSKILELSSSNKPFDIPNLRETDEVKPKFRQYVNLGPVIQALKQKGIKAQPEHLDDGRTIGLFGEMVMEEGKPLIEVDFKKLQKMYPVIRFMNSLRRGNDEKAGTT